MKTTPISNTPLLDDNIQCSICANKLTFLIERLDNYAYYYCPNCTLVTSVSKPSPQQVTDFYSGFLYGMPDEANYNSLVINTAKMVDGIHRDIRQYKKGENLSLLDLGGGTGFFANTFSNIGYKVTLIDIDKKACEYVKNRFPDIAVINTDLLEYVPENKFDVVFVNQVIEHYRDVRNFMTLIKSFVKPDGIVIITTPNQQCKEYFFLLEWWAYYLKKTSNNFRSGLTSIVKFIKRPWICCDPPRHIHAFNKKSISALANETGWEIERLFTEYSTKKYYDGTFNIVVFRRNYWKHPLTLLHHLYVFIGISFIRLIDKKNNYGENMVIFLKPGK